jgi:peptide/nickel transport system permease protein
VSLVVASALVSSLGLSLHDPQLQDPNAVLKGVSLDHPFGTDQFGRDLFSLVLEGIGVSLEIACIATLIAGVLGTLGGIVAGYLGGIAAMAILRVSDIIFAIPAILLALSIVTALGPGILDSALAIGVGYIPIFVRVVRAPVLSLRNADFIRAGQVLGFSRTRLLFRHILPSVSGAIAVQASLALAWAILAEASLSFLGLGPPPPTASLGQMVSDSSSLAGFAWWTLAGPSIAIVLAVIGFNFLGDGLRDAADPRTRSR